MTPSGSYDLDTLTDAQGELDRLRRQAQSFQQLEAGVLTRSGLKPHNRVLELGCGPGFVSRLLAQLAPQGTLVSLDNSLELLTTQRRVLDQPPRGGAHTLQASATALPLIDGWADFAYARFLLQHVPGPEAVVREACRVLAPGGRLCVVDSDDGLIIHHPWQEEIAELLEQVRQAQSGRGGDRLIGRQLMGLFREAGLVNLRVNVVSLTSAELPFDLLFNVLFGYKAALLGWGERLTDLHQRLQAEADQDRFLLTGGVFVAVGEKP